MRRRDFVVLLGAAAASPVAARAQQADGLRRIGVLLGVADGDTQAAAGVAAFTKAPAELGWVDGHNVRLDMRWGAADVRRMRAVTNS
jgi:putative ABC transport system substrate-binding protein